MGHKINLKNMKNKINRYMQFKIEQKKQKLVEN